MYVNLAFRRTKSFEDKHDKHKFVVENIVAFNLKIYAIEM